MPKHLRSLTVSILIIGFCSSVGIYFRTFALRKPTVLKSEMVQSKGRAVVMDGLVKYFEAQIRKLAPDINPDQAKRMAEERATAAIASDPSEFREKVNEAVQQLYDETYPKPSRTYLLGVDSYFFFFLTDYFIQQNSTKIDLREGRFFHPYRSAPTGRWTYLYLHSILGYYFYKLVSPILQNHEPMYVLSYYPLLLFVATVCFFYVACSAMGIDRLSALAATLFMTLSSMHIKRSLFGWYDTDPYSLMLPAAIASTYFALFLDRVWLAKYKVWLGIAGGLLTLIYAFFWPGWPYIFLVLSAASIGSVLVSMLLKDGKASLLATYLLGYVLTVMVFSLLILSPSRTWENLQNIGFLKMFKLEDSGLWPNLFLTVGETHRTELKELMMLTANGLVYAFAVFGLLMVPFGVFLKKSNKFLHVSIFLFLLFGSAFFLASGTERFSILVIVPVCLSAGLGIHFILRFVAEMGEKYLRLRDRGRIAAQTLVFVVILVVTLPKSILYARVVGMTADELIILNDAWYETLTGIREKTPEDAIINTWWAPGHFITGIAKRSVISDGAAQHEPLNYWVAKAFMATDEKISTGIFRMVNTSRDSAVDFLRAQGFKLSETISTLINIVGLSKDQAKSELRARLDESQIEALLEYTHDGTGLPHSFVLIYDDLIKQNIAMAIVADWDFAKAEGLKSRGKTGLLRKMKRFFSVSRERERKYVEKSTYLAGRILKYTPESSLIRKEGSVLFFENGLRVDLDTKEASVVNPERKLNGPPISLFYVEEGNLIEKKFEDAKVDVSALIYIKGNVIYSVLADRELIRSTLFELYYLEGQTLHYYSPIIHTYDPKSKTRIYVFKIDFERFVSDLNQKNAGDI